MQLQGKLPNGHSNVPGESFPYANNNQTSTTMGSGTAETEEEQLKRMINKFMSLRVPPE